MDQNVSYYVEGLNSPFYRQTPYMAIPLFGIFSEPPAFGKIFPQYRPIEIPHKHKNKLMWQSYLFFIFRRLKNNVTSFFC